MQSFSLQAWFHPYSHFALTFNLKSLYRAANQRIPRAWDIDISQPPPPLFAEPARAPDGFGEGSSYAPSKGEVYKASLGLTGKNPVQALGELCTRLRLPPPYYTVAVRGDKFR